VDSGLVSGWSSSVVSGLVCGEWFSVWRVVYLVGSGLVGRWCFSVGSGLVCGEWSSERMVL
jgi:hypothetical protein